MLIKKQKILNFKVQRKKPNISRFCRKMARECLFLIFQTNKNRLKEGPCKKRGAKTGFPLYISNEGTQSGKFISVLNSDTKVDFFFLNNENIYGMTEYLPIRK